MNTPERAVIDLAESWFDSWSCHGSASPSAFTQTCDLFEALSQLRNERCPYRPNAMWTELQAQVDAESLTRREREEYLSDVTVVEDLDGLRIETDYRYLESNRP